MTDAVRVRKFREADYRAARDRGLAAVARVDKPWMQHVDFFLCLRKVVNGEVQSVVIEDTYLLVYDVGTPWFSNDLMLNELMVLKLHGGGASFDCVPRALEGLAKHHGAKGIAVGTALAQSDRALTRLYARHGFAPVAVELYKPAQE